MQVNFSVKTTQPAFKAKIEDNLLDAAYEHFCNHSSSKNYGQYCSALKRFSELPDTENVSIGYKKVFKNGKPSHMLYGFHETDFRAVVLTKKDFFRQLIDKFSYMTEAEFLTKMSLLKKVK